jgi:hypothetical protein
MHGLNRCPYDNEEEEISVSSKVRREIYQKNRNATQNKMTTTTKNGLTPLQSMIAYLGGSTIQTIADNPITAYRQLIQQYAKGANGGLVSPAYARQEANAVFRTTPLRASLSGLGPRLVGVGFKRIPKFGALLGIAYLVETGEDVGFVAATGASILSAPFINPIRFIEKQQRASFRECGAPRSALEIIRESAKQNYRPLFRGTVPLMGHSLASATTGLVGQPQIQKYIKRELNSKTALGDFAVGLVSSVLVSPIYIMMTNPLSRLEVIMQTSPVTGKGINVQTAIKEVFHDCQQFGLRGMFRGQGIGIVKAVISLTLFHQGRLCITDCFVDAQQDA